MVKVGNEVDAEKVKQFILETCQDTLFADLVRSREFKVNAVSGDVESFWADDDGKIRERIEIRIELLTRR